MLDLEYDAVVVGAGPAGSMAAKTLAENGVKVLVLEKKQEIGNPKRCAEGININGLKRVGLEPDPAWALRAIDGALVYAPNGMSVEVLLGEVAGYVLERKVFEKHLARDAIRAGARYMVKTHVSGAVMEDGRVVGVRARCMDEEFTVRCRLVIAADGVDSKIARSAGLKSTNSMSDYHSGFQYEMAGLKINGSKFLHLYFGEQVAPLGYIWIFPKDYDVANVGIGILGRLSQGGKKAKDYLDKFIADHPEIFRDASPIEVNSGGIPVNPEMERIVSDGLMLVGDAAHQVNPIHGGGISIGMNAGRLAGVVGAAALKEGDVSAERLSEYERAWMEADGIKSQKLLKTRMFLEKLKDEDFETLADILTGEDIMKLTLGDTKPMVKKFISRAPKILPLAKKFLN